MPHVASAGSAPGALDPRSRWGTTRAGPTTRCQPMATRACTRGQPGHLHAQDDGAGADAGRGWTCWGPPWPTMAAVEGAGGPQARRHLPDEWGVRMEAWGEGVRCLDVGPRPRGAGYQCMLARRPMHHSVTALSRLTRHTCGLAACYMGKDGTVFKGVVQVCSGREKNRKEARGKVSSAGDLGRPLQRVVVQQLLYEVHMRHDHAPAAVKGEAQSVHGIPGAMGGETSEHLAACIKHARTAKTSPGRSTPLALHRDSPLGIFCLEEVEVCVPLVPNHFAACEAAHWDNHGDRVRPPAPTGRLVSGAGGEIRRRSGAES